MRKTMKINLPTYLGFDYVYPKLTEELANALSNRKAA